MPRRLVDGKLPQKPPDADKGGRKPLLEINPDIEENIMKAIRIGQNVISACALMGVDDMSLRAWVRKGRMDPTSVYGKFLDRIIKTVAEFEIRGIAVLDKHAQGSPAEYIMEPAMDSTGAVLMDEFGKPIMKLARDPDGKPILKSSEIKSDWRAAQALISSRLPRYWNPNLAIDQEHLLTFADDKDHQEQQNISFEQSVANTVKKIMKDI